MSDVLINDMKLCIEDIFNYMRTRDNKSLQHIHKSMMKAKQNHEREYREGLVKLVETNPDVLSVPKMFQNEHIEDFKTSIQNITCDELSKTINEVFYMLSEEERESARFDKSRRTLTI